MANFKYNPPTRDFCPICIAISDSLGKPIIETYQGKASSAEKAPIHNWFYFVLGYSPKFPEYIFARENINSSHLIADPFMGTGTTLVYAKEQGVNSKGIDANDFFIEVAKTKTGHYGDSEKISRDIKRYLKELTDIFSKFSGNETLLLNNETEDFIEYARKHRPDMLEEKYICDIPFAKLHLAKTLSDNADYLNEDSKKLIKLAIDSLIVPSSNVKYGPGFGVSKKLRTDVNLIKMLSEKLSRMLDDIKTSCNHPGNAEVFHGDSRELDEYFGEELIDFMITSPPYPGDHEYTKHTRLELIFNGVASSKDEFKVIKKRMLRGSTTNLYKDDNDKSYVLDIPELKKITDLVDRRLKHDLEKSNRNSLSGFEKLYVKLIWEYFGGMAKVFESSLRSLKPGGKFILLVSDSHAFKMVHIRTADILGKIAIKYGFSSYSIELWQNKLSTSHNYNIPEEILTLTK